MNVQREPLFDIVSTLSVVLKTEVPALKHAVMGWPDPKWLQVEGNLPAVYFVDISERGRNARSRDDIHREVVAADGSGQILQEKLRLHTLLQITLFAHTKGDRDQLGWRIKQYLVANPRLPLMDYAPATPAPTGEFMLLHFRGDHKSLEGSPNCWQRDLTFEVQSRVLDAFDGFQVKTLRPTTNGA